MPSDTAVLNDGTKARLFLYAPRSVSDREPLVVPVPCVRNVRIQMGRDCKPRNYSPALVLSSLLCHSYCYRTLQNTWNKPWRPASSISTQLPVRIPIAPTSQWTELLLLAYKNEESTGVGLRQSGLARLPAISHIPAARLTVRFEIRFLCYHQIRHRRSSGCTRIHCDKFEQGYPPLYNVGSLLIYCLQAGIEETGHVSHSLTPRRPPFYLERFRAGSKRRTYHVPDLLSLISPVLNPSISAGA